MAILCDRWDRHSLQVQPIPPSLDGPQDAYGVTVRDNEEVLFQQQYTTYPDSPDGHWDVWRLTRALRSAPSLVDALTDFNLSTSGNPKFREEVKLHVDMGWLSVLLWGNTFEHRHGQTQPWQERRCIVDVSLLSGPQFSVQEQILSPSVRFQLLCHPEAVAKFGEELLSECREALLRRQELGIPAPADAYIDSDD